MELDFALDLVERGSPKDLRKALKEIATVARNHEASLAYVRRSLADNNCTTKGPVSCSISLP